MGKISTLTLNGLVELFRDYGISTSAETVTAGIEQGLFPFAVCARPGGHGNRSFLIFKKEAVAWLDSHCD